MTAISPSQRQSKRQRVNPATFLDLEAAVDKDYDTDDAPIESDTEFLDDDDIEGAREYRNHASFLRQLLVEEDGEARQLEQPGDSGQEDNAATPEPSSVFAELHALIQRRNGRRPSQAPLPAQAQRDRVDGDLVGTSEWSEELRSRLPKADEKLFEIRCRVRYLPFNLFSLRLTSLRKGVRRPPY